MTGEPSVVWFRRDLRLDDNPAIDLAAAAGGPVTALYVIDPALFGAAGHRRRAQLVGHLDALDVDLRGHGGRLRVERGDPAVVVPAVADEVGATVVVANADTTPYSRRRDRAVHRVLGDRFATTWGTLVHHPGAIVTGSGSVSRVFTPFYKRWAASDPAPWPEGPAAGFVGEPGDGVPAADEPPPQPPGASAAADRLAAFLDRVDRYPDDRDRPDLRGTSGLSADLRFGTLSPRTVAATVGTANAARAAFVRQLAWRDWYAHLLWELPSLVDHALRPELDGIEWRNDPADLDAWRHGRTGFPLVDAGMRELAATGWMHNRVRMVTASFLVKDLLVDWRQGERWFRRRLVDFDVAQNVGNWQWVAGTGPDAAPYFRVFNPTAQSERFDPGGDYIRRWVPELASVPARWIHEPSAAPPLDLAGWGVTIGDDYPAPIVDHASARDRALDAYRAARGDD